MRNPKGRGISTNLAIVSIVVLVIVAVAGWGVYAVSPITKTVSQSGSNTATLTTTQTLGTGGVATETVTQTITQTGGSSVASNYITPSTTNAKFTIATFAGVQPFSNVYFVHQSGLDSKYMPNANVTFFGNAALIPQGLASGQIQMAVLDMTQLLPSISKGVPLQIVANLNSFPAEWEMMVAKNSSYTTLQSLHKCSFAVGSIATTTSYLIQYVLAQQLGWKLNNDYTLDALGTSAAETAAVLTGASCAIPLQPSIAYPYVLSGQLKSVFNFTAPYPGETLFATTSFVQQNPGAVQAAVYAFLQADLMWDTNQSAAINTLVSSFKLTPDIAAVDYQFIQYSTDGYISLTGVQRGINLLVTNGAISQNMSSNSIVSPEFAPVTN